MPWTVTDPMTERARFILAHQDGLYSTTELCQRFGVSRFGRLQVASTLQGGRLRRPRRPKSRAEAFPSSNPIRGRGAAGKLPTEASALGAEEALGLPGAPVS